MTAPVVVLVAFAFGSFSGGSAGSSAAPRVLPPVTVSPPPSDAAAETPCAKVIGALPLALANLSVRQTATDPASPFVVAWGDPPVVLRCGVSPVHIPLTAQLIAVNGVEFLPVRGKSATVWTAVDRKVYIEVTVPNSYQQPPLGPIAEAIAGQLGPVCKVPAVGQPEPSQNQLCTHRS